MLGGLKRPITVSTRPNTDPVEYDLVCGQGRLEAFIELKQEKIPAIVIDADESDCLVMSLVENCARRQHRGIDLMQEIGILRKRGYPLKKGRFSVLSDVDLVLHVRPRADGSVQMTLFNKSTVLSAFEQNRKALMDAGQAHLPVWVSPEEESGWRRAGSRFGTQALWSLNVQPGGSRAAAASDEGRPSTGIRQLSIAEAKMAVAAKYDVPPENVEIIVRG